VVKLILDAIGRDSLKKGYRLLARAGRARDIWRFVGGHQYDGRDVRHVVLARERALAFLGIYVSTRSSKDRSKSSFARCEAGVQDRFTGLGDAGGANRLSTKVPFANDKQAPSSRIRPIRIRVQIDFSGLAWN
jgi:hypothetical protein